MSECGSREVLELLETSSCRANQDRERKRVYLASIIESELISELDRHGMLLSSSVLTNWLVACGSDAR